MPPTTSLPAASTNGRAAVRSGGNRRPALGEALVRLGFVTAADVQAAVARQRTDKRKLGDILIADGKITRDQLARALALQMGIDVYNPADGVDGSAAQLIDEKTARRYHAAPVRFDTDGSLVVAMADPTNVLAIDDLRIVTGYHIRPLLAAHDEVTQLISSTARIDDVVADLVDEAGADYGGQSEDIREAIDDAPVVRLVNWVITQAVDTRASDIHFEPQAQQMVVRFRVDGVLREVTNVPLRLASGVVSRIKIMADLDIAERRVPQDGRVGLNVGGRSLDLRVASLPTVFGEKIVIRVLDKTNVMIQLADSGFAADTLAGWERCYKRPYGAVLVTGPTGSGKSTTLYGTLNQLNSADKNIITVEDPVEYRLQGINQVQVNAKAGLTFAAGLRSILRCDPDIVMIGEVRDKETAQIAIESALTGHLVLATLHTNDSAGALPRLSEMGVEPFLTASAIVGILAQRLARKLCGECRKRTFVPHSVLREAAGSSALPRGLPDPAPVYEPVGCSRCGGAGYKGRMGIFELLVLTDAVQKLALAGASAADISRQARSEGMRTLREDGVLKVLKGVTTLEELARTVA